eukprot:499678-Rhodomonas_salina.1
MCVSEKERFAFAVPCGATTRDRDESSKRGEGERLEEESEARELLKALALKIPGRLPPQHAPPVPQRRLLVWQHPPVLQHATHPAHVSSRRCRMEAHDAGSLLPHKHPSRSCNILASLTPPSPQNLRGVPNQLRSTRNGVRWEAGAVQSDGRAAGKREDEEGGGSGRDRHLSAEEEEGAELAHARVDEFVLSVLGQPRPLRFSRSVSAPHHHPTSLPEIVAQHKQADAVSEPHIAGRHSLA